MMIAQHEAIQRIQAFVMPFNMSSNTALCLFAGAHDASDGDASSS